MPSTQSEQVASHIFDIQLCPRNGCSMNSGTMRASKIYLTFISDLMSIMQSRLVESEQENLGRLLLYQLCKTSVVNSVPGCVVARFTGD